MADDTQRPIVIKRVRKTGGGAHGGAWKIAYADFVTAMMAFFLLMWLLGSATKAQLQGISEYFKTPLKVAMLGGTGSGDATSIIKGGGEDLTRKSGQVNQTDIPSDAKSRLPREEQEKLDVARLQDLKNKLDKAIENNRKLQQFRKQLKIDITQEGLRIQIVDDQSRPMFDSGSAVMKPYTRDILREIGRTLNEVPNRISLSGHTDGVPYSGGEAGYSNWELSADRANASRRELVAAGMPDDKLARVVGLAASDPLLPEDPRAATNRRITITVLTREAEERLLGKTIPTVPAAQWVEEKSDNPPENVQR